ncbi:MAG: hypothetical protein JXA30_14770 [Deltaproteobacteria bacterium]|nr:hypothetical protein [Deltaproteobacteria bacterium]
MGKKVGGQFACKTERARNQIITCDVEVYDQKSELVAFAVATLKVL